MSEEKKEDDKIEENKGGKEEKKEEEKEEDEKKEEEAPQEVVLKVDMHCEACARKVARSLKGFQGVEEVTVDVNASRVVVKGKTADPIKVSERILKKSGRKVEIISPLPKPPPEENKDQEDKPQEKEEKKDEQPSVISVVLKVGMHCEACAQVLQKRIRKIQGIESVTTDLANGQVTVKGLIDPTKLVDYVYRKTKKQVCIVKDDEKKEEEKKDEEKKEEEKKEVEEAKLDEESKIDIKKSEYYAPKYYTEYSYAPQMFSDENPNACSIM